MDIGLPDYGKILSHFEAKKQAVEALHKLPLYDPNRLTKRNAEVYLETIDDCSKIVSYCQSRRRTYTAMQDRLSELLHTSSPWRPYNAEERRTRKRAVLACKSIVSNYNPEKKGNSV